VDPSRRGVTPPDAPPPVAYLDSSALIKLVVVEAESGALRRELVHWPQRTSSLLARVEVTRAADRLGASAPALAVRVLADLDLLAVDLIIPAAERIGDVQLRSLDAIHLATAASIAVELGALITYDHRMIAEGRALGLPVVTPT
jgi:predicted nucleic acid-binding protein